MSEWTNPKVHSLYFYLARVKCLMFYVLLWGRCFVWKLLQWMLRKYRKKTRSLGETEKGMWKRVTVTAVTTLTARGVFSDTQTAIKSKKKFMWPADTDGVSVPEWEWLRVQEAAGDCHFGANYSATEKGIAIVCVGECLRVVMKMKGWPSPFRQTLEPFQRQFGENFWVMLGEST